MEQPVLQATSLRKSFKDLVAVADVSFEIAPGETYGLRPPEPAGQAARTGSRRGPTSPQ